MADKSKDKGRIGKREYLEKLAPLQLELNRMARWLQVSGKRLLVLSMTANLLLLAFFKYFHFFEDNLVDLVSTIVGHRVSPTGWTIILPMMSSRPSHGWSD